MILNREMIAARRARAVWMARRGWKAREIARELGVHLRTVERYKAAAQAGATR